MGGAARLTQVRTGQPEVFWKSDAESGLSRDS